METYEEGFNRWYNHALGCGVCFIHSPREIVERNLCTVGKPLIEEWMRAADRERKEDLKPKGS